MCKYVAAYAARWNKEVQKCQTGTEGKRLDIMAAVCIAIRDTPPEFPQSAYSSVVQVGQYRREGLRVFA